MAGLVFLMYHCVTADVRFNPVWIAIYVAVALVLACAFAGIEFLADSVRSQKKEHLHAITPEERRCVQTMDALSHRIRRSPWLFLLIAGEDGFFFLPLVYLGINPATAIAVSAIFTLLHYQDKPTHTLLGSFVITASHILIVLPHGILPMVLGHYILDAIALGMAPVLKKWVQADQGKNAQQGGGTYVSKRQLYHAREGSRF